MKIVNRLEDTLNGGYNGLYGEVVTEDCYRLKSIDWQPDVILDLGGNVGVFARFARTLFPKAFIVSVEPNDENYTHFCKFTNDNNSIILNKAIGTELVWRCNGAVNGAHESYISNGLGYPLEGEISGMSKSSIETIMPFDLINEYVKPTDKTILKLDIEGNENIIWDHAPSMQAMKQIDYIIAEVHWGALHDGLVQEVRQKTFEALASFIPTHKCELINTAFYAIKR